VFLQFRHGLDGIIPQIVGRIRHPIEDAQLTAMLSRRDAVTVIMGNLVSLVGYGMILVSGDSI
jgi:hypothetical protein